MADFVSKEDSVYSCSGPSDLQPLSQDISTITGNDRIGTAQDIATITLRLDHQSPDPSTVDDWSDTDDELHDSAKSCHECRRRKRMCSKVLYVWISLLVLSCLIALIIVGVLVVGPYKQAENFQSSMCTPVSSTYRTEYKCACGKGCNSGYPCLELVVDLHDSSATTRRVVLHENEAALNRPCSFYPPCKKSRTENERAVSDYVKAYGTSGKDYSCLYNPESPSEVIRTRRFNLHHVIHGMVWSSVIFLLSLVIFIVIVRRKGYVCEKMAFVPENKKVLPYM